MADLISPPYDVISAEQKKEFLARSPHNIVRLILPDGEHPYEQARRTLDEWIRQQVLITDSDPCIYCYHQTYRTPDGDEKTRKGFLALIRLVDFDRGIVLPHEATLSAPKEDRLQLLRSCRTNFSPIFSLYSDPEQEIEKYLDTFTSSPPRAKVRDSDGIENSFWSVSDPETVSRVIELMKPHWVLIADGHHRYESCLLYRNERTIEDADPDAPFHFTLMFFCNMNQAGITVLPYNRAVLNLPSFDAASVISKASEYFSIESFESQERANQRLPASGLKTTAFLARFAGDSRIYVFTLKHSSGLRRFYPPETPDAVQTLDINVLHKIFIGAILSISDEDVTRQTYLKYYKSAREEMKDYEAGKLQIAFFLNPTRVDQVVEVSRAGKKMPQKSTFFYPKLMTGFVMNKHQ